MRLTTGETSNVSVLAPSMAASASAVMPSALPVLSLLTSLILVLLTLLTLLALNCSDLYHIRSARPSP